MSRRQRRGSSLLELIVTIVLLSIMTGVATMAARRVQAPDSTDPARMVLDSAHRAISDARPATIHLLNSGQAADATANADGSIIADSVLDIERLAGRQRHAR